MKSSTAAIFTPESRDKQAAEYALGAVLLGEFHQAELQRRETEERWLQDLRQYRGKYDPEVLASRQDRSKAFVRKTRVKVKTVDSRVADLLFPAGTEKNWTSTRRPSPCSSPDQVVEIREHRAAPRAGRCSRQRPGPAPAPSDPPVRPGRAWGQEALPRRCPRRSRTSWPRPLQGAARRSTPATCTAPASSRARWSSARCARASSSRAASGSRRAETYVVPFVDYVPLWRFYPDMAATELEQCRFVYERHLMTKRATWLDLA
jgi:hypothetical protein